MPSSCKLCGSLPNRMTVNTGRNLQFPVEVYRLEEVAGVSGYRRCPECHDWFTWEVDQPAYGSGSMEDTHTWYERVDAKSKAWLEEKSRGPSPGREAPAPIRPIAQAPAPVRVIAVGSSQCSVCGSLPRTLTANTGRGGDFPDAFHRLEEVDAGFGRHRRCPECHTWYLWWEDPQAYGSGNEDTATYERMDRRDSEDLETRYQRATPNEFGRRKL